MGTDMHLMVEIKDGDKWRPLFSSPFAAKVPRNYPLFSILADVRNLAGRHERVWQEPHTHTLDDGEEVDVPGWWYDVEDGGHERITPISEPRGIPKDASPEWQANAMLWSMRSNCVDVSWVTPEEILEADWDQMLIRHGIILEADYIEFTETGRTPKKHASGAGGEGVLIVTEAEYSEGKRGDTATMVNASWSEGPLRKNIQPEFFGMVEEIRDQANSDSTKVRFMLLFES